MERPANWRRLRRLLEVMKPMHKEVRLAKASDLPDGGMLSCPLDEDDVLVARIGEEFFAVSDWCTHAGARLHEGYLNTAERNVECPIHGACFDLRTGRPVCLPADEPVPTYHVRTDGVDIFLSVDD